MNRPWMPLYIADYLADTSHLNTMEHGAYLLLIMHYWRHDGLPADEEYIRRITKMTHHQWKKSRDVLAKFFDGWRHKRCDQEIAQAIEKSKANSANAKLSHEVRRANAQRTQTQSQSHTESEKKEKNIGRSQATRPTADSSFQEFWKVYPKRSGTNPKAPAFQRFQAAVRGGAAPAEIIAGARRYADHMRAEKKIGTEFVKQSMTWLSQRLWEDYAATAPPDADFSKPPWEREGITESQWRERELAKISPIRRDSAGGENRPDKPVKLQLAG
jgi:uncharacterized protein YdaU (DUF1376 family)